MTVTIFDVGFDSDCLTVRLSDRRELSAPLAWLPRLLAATPAERSEWRLCAGGEGIHWPQIDEDIALGGLLR